MISAIVADLHPVDAQYIMKIQRPPCSPGTVLIPTPFDVNQFFPHEMSVSSSQEFAGTAHGDKNSE